MKITVLHSSLNLTERRWRSPYVTAFPACAVRREPIVRADSTVSKASTLMVIYMFVNLTDCLDFCTEVLHLRKT